MALADPEPLGTAPSTVDPELPPAPGQSDELKPLAELDRPAPFAPVLRHRDLAFTAGSFRTIEPEVPAARIVRLDPSRAVADIRLLETGEADDWEPLSDLLSAGPDDGVFVPEVEADGTTRLRFGQGHNGGRSTHGKTPVAGSEFFARYRVGTGRAGNIGADSLAHIAASGLAAPNVVRVRNPLPAAGGSDRESIAEVRQRAPVSFHAQRRAVTLADYEALLDAHPNVQRAHARRRWLGSWPAIFLSVDRVGSLEVDEPFREAMLAYLEPFRMMGHDLTIDAPIYVPLQVGLKACVNRDFFAEDVRAALEDRFSSGLREDGQRGFFHPDNITFSSTVYLSRIYEAAMQVAGVDDVHVTAFQRAGAILSTAADEGVLTFGPRELPILSNDPDRPDAGTLTVETEGGR